jgi:Big-like domain-containing protein/ASPM-SPD-2-Hydin domain-containing protein
MKIRSNVTGMLLACLAVLAAAPALAQDVTLSPNSVSFGNQVQGTSSAGQKITLKNGQTTAISIKSIKTNLPDYTEINNCPTPPSTLAAGASCIITVTFAPIALGSRTGVLSVVDTGSSGQQMAFLGGTGIAAVTTSPTSLSFGNQAMSLRSAPLLVTLTNNQSKSLSITKISTNLSDYTDTSTCPLSPNTLAAGASCSVSVFFTPSVLGTRSGTLTVTDTAGVNPTVSLTGTGVLAAIVSPATLAFGTQTIHTSSLPQTVTLTNNQSTVLSISKIATSITDFSVTSTCPISPSTLAAGASCTASVTFQPTVAGNWSGTLGFTDSANNSPQKVALSGTGTTASLVSISVTPSPASMPLGSTLQLTATGSYSDGTKQNLTNSVTWSSSSSGIASVNNTGLADGVSIGNATVTAALSSISGSTLVSVTQDPVAYYVSPTGNDSNPGTLALPLKTAQKAESLVVANHLGTHCSAQTSPIIVQFRAGRWDSLALTMTASDSGCSSTVPVVFENYPGETPVFSGGVQVLNWTNTSGSTWQTTLPASTVNFEALYYNGVRRLRPRLGSTRSTGPLGSYYRVANNVAGFNDRFYYDPTDPLTDTWQNYSPSKGNPCGQPPGAANLQGDIQVAIFEEWDVSWERISCIDTVNHLVYLTGSTAGGSSHGYIPTHRYVIENVKDELTLPGQWFLDRSVTGAWKLTYIANPGENPNKDTVMIPQQPHVLTANGLNYRTFSGLTFSYDDYVVPSTGYAGAQAEYTVPAAVACSDCSNVTFDSDSFTNIEGYALAFPTDNKATATGDVIQNSAFWDVGAGGLQTGRVPTGSETDANVFQFATIENNLVQGYGRKFPGAAGIVNLLGHDVSTIHNDVTDGYNQGVMICFPSFSFSCASQSNSSGGFNQTVTYNHIWDLGQGILNDFGGVYFATYGATGDVANNNKIHDITDASSQDTDGYGGNAFYIDRGGPIQLKNNLIYRSVNAFNVTMGPPSTGQVITADNNIFAFSRLRVINLYSCAKAGYSQFSLSNNIVLQDKTPLSVPTSNLQAGASYLGSPVGSAQAFASNDYWNTTEVFATDPLAFNSQPSTCQTRNYYTLAAWKALGEDAGSLSVDPGFAAPSYPGDDYNFKAGPPNIGFIPFNTTGTCSTCPGRTAPVIAPAPVQAGFPTAPFNPATDY